MADLRVAVLLSGGGTTLANLLNVRDRGGLMADIDLVVSSRASARGLAIAEDAGIKTEVVEASNYTISAREGEVIRDWPAMSRDLDRILLGGKYDLVCMAGFLCRYLFSHELKGRIINIHPSLIPMFCGQGMYGHRVHEAVVDAGVKVTGCTVHLADLEYDTGPIILQRCCPVYSDDDPDEVAARVFREECAAYPAAINLIAQGYVHLTTDRRTYVDGDRYIERFNHDVD
ncbi:MAG: phosphoribosylglycinamide formyltransferase [Planctomycetaceae bacterium]|nr:phosphoribosylglycinamide formyltransferase [Planctomycetaceae bacterium]